MVSFSYTFISTIFAGKIPFKNEKLQPYVFNRFI